MKLRTILILLLVVAAAAAQAQNFTGATVVRHDARAGVANGIAGIAGRGTVWVAWAVPFADDASICCYGTNSKRSGCCGGCALDGSRGWSINNHDDDLRNRTGTMIVAARIDGGVIKRVRMFDSACSIEGNGSEVHWLENADPGSSIDYLRSQIGKSSEGSALMGTIAMHDHPAAEPALERLAGADQSHKVREDALFWIGQRGGERGFRYLRDFLRGNESTSLRKKAIFSMSQSEVDQAVPELISIARNDRSSDVRREAIFWLGQRAGEAAAAELRRAVDDDPDQDVREHAVFAISQLPRHRSVPMLIDLVRTHKSPRVREKAMFWLAQTGDQRAIELIEEILMK